jgi:hypothetical protein
MINRGYSQFVAAALMLMASLCSAQESAQAPTRPDVREAWRKAMEQKALPKNGCFKAEYPSTEWQEQQCGRPSPYLNQGGKGAVLNQAGDGDDYVAQAPGSNLILSATGKFLQIAGGSSAAGESGFCPARDHRSSHAAG